MHRLGCMTHCKALWLIYVLSLSSFVSGSSRAASTVHVHSRDSGQGPTLIQALQNETITHIIIVPDHLDVAAELEGLPPKFRLDRNVTVSGAKGTDTVLDQQFQRARLQLCGNCTWKFSNITIANDTKSSSAGNEMFVAAQLGARLVLQDANVLRLACPSPADALGVLSITPRSAAFQDGVTQQHYSTRDVSIQGTSYPAALFANDFSTDVPPSQEGRSNTGGYALMWHDTGRPCRNYVPTSCLDTKSMEACTQDLTESLLAGAQSARGGGGLAPGTLAAAVAVPVVVAALAAAGLGVWCHRRSRRPKSPKTFSRRKRELPDDLAYSDTDLEAGSGGPNSSTPDCSGGPLRPDDQPLRRPLGLQAGWTVAKTCTTPYLGQVEDDRIEFGELIGSGSFGRVYQAKWAGRDVAVKVIEHNTDTTVPVEREVSLMLSFNHPNIVRAFHFVTRVHTTEVMPHHPSKDNELTKGSSAGSRAGAGTLHTTPSCTPTKQLGKDSSISDDANISLAAAAGNPHAAAVVAAAAAANKNSGNTSKPGGAGAAAGAGAGGSNNSRASGGSDGAPVIRTLPPRPGGKPGTTPEGSSAHTSSSNSRGSAGGSSDKPSATGSVSNNPQLQLVQRLPSLTGGQPRLVHKVETWLVQEYCDCGTLASVATEWKHEPESDQKMLERLQLLQDCARGLKELHERNVVHGDLNARNVLLSSSGVTNLGVVAKLADLGLSRIVRSHRSHHSTNTVGTMSHVAPELLRYGHMSTAGDIYAFGIMMWELYTGQAAFRKLHVGQFFEAIVVRNLRPIIPRGMGADYQLLMQSCWSASPNDRPTVDRLLNCIKLMVEVRQQRSTDTPTAAAAAPSTAPSSPRLSLQHPPAAVTSGSATAAAAVAAAAAGSAFNTNSAPLPPVGLSPAAAAASDAALLRELMSPSQQQQLPPSRLGPVPPATAATLAAGMPAGGGGGSGSPRFPQRSAYSVSSGTAAAAASAAGASALPGLLSLLKERGPQTHSQQQQLLREMAGGRLHSSCPEEQRFSRSQAAYIIGEDMPRLTPINTGRQGSREGSLTHIQVGHSQSDPLPAHGTVPHTIQQQILMQLQQHQQQQHQHQQQPAERSSGSFHGFPEASASSGGSCGGMPTPLLFSYAHGATMVTPITGIKYQYPSSSSGGGGGAGGPPQHHQQQQQSQQQRQLKQQRLKQQAQQQLAVEPSGGGVTSSSRRSSTGSLNSSLTNPAARSSSGPVRLPGTSSLARTGSLGTSSRHWYWQRSPAPPFYVGGDEDDTRSVSDQDGPAEKLGDEMQPGCPDVMAQVQMDNNWYV